MQACVASRPSNEPTLKGVRHSLKSIVCPQLLVNAVKMIAKRLRADSKRFCNSGGCGTCREHFEDFKLLRRWMRNRRRPGDVSQIRHFFGNGDHAAEHLLTLFLLTDITRQMNKQRPASSAVEIRNGREIDPDPILAAGTHIQIEIRYVTRGFGTAQRRTAFTTDICTQCPYSMQDSSAGLSEHLLRGMAKKSLCCMIPETNLTGLADGKGRIRRIFEKGEQFRFQHLHILERLTGPACTMEFGSNPSSRPRETLRRSLGFILGLIRQGETTFGYRVQVGRISAEGL